MFEMSFYYFHRFSWEKIHSNDRSHAMVVVWCLAQVCQTQGVDHISNDGLSINAHLASYYIATWVCRGEEGSNPVSLPLVFFMAYIKTSTAGPRPAPRATGTLRFTAE